MFLRLTAPPFFKLIAPPFFRLIAPPFFKLIAPPFFRLIAPPFFKLIAPPFFRLKLFPARIEVLVLPASATGAAAATLAFCVVFSALIKDFFWIDMAWAPQNLNFYFNPRYADYPCRRHAKLSWRPHNSEFLMESMTCMGALARWPLGQGERK